MDSGSTTEVLEMDAALFVAVKKGTTIPTSEVHKRAMAWQGTHADEESVFVYGNSQLKSCAISGWVMELLPANFQNADLDSYLVDDDTITLLESEVNDIELNTQSTLPDWLIEIMSRSPVWLVAYLWHWDEVDEVTCMSVNDAVEKLRAELRWDGKRHGFLIYGENPLPLR
jgi:hypothetical protein